MAGVDSTRFDAYLEELEAEKERALRSYDLLLIPGLELDLRQRRPRSRGARTRALLPRTGRDGRRAHSGDPPGANCGSRDRRCAPERPERHPASRGTRFFWHRWAGLEGLVDRYELFNRRQVFPFLGGRRRASRGRDRRLPRAGQPRGLEDDARVHEGRAGRAAVPPIAGTRLPGALGTRPRAPEQGGRLSAGSPLGHQTFTNTAPCALRALVKNL